jgi:ABC-type transport system substrate-binding protein
MPPKEPIQSSDQDLITTDNHVIASADAITQDAPVSTTPQPRPVISKPPRKSPLKWILTTLIIALILGGGYLAWNHFHKAAQNKTTSIVKDIPLLRIGSPNGPIGSKYIYPNPQGTILSLGMDYQIFEGLIGYTNQKLTPLLATSWTNPSKTTWVFQLAHNVTFQNGDVMTASDVANSLNTNMKDDNWSGYLSTVSSIKATGTNEVTITTNQPDALLLNRLVTSFVFKKDTAGKYYGTGPYTLDKSKPDTDHLTTLVAYEGYHGGSPKAKVLDFTIYDKDSDLVAAFKNKKIDTFDDNADPKTQANFGSAASVLSYQDPGAFGINLDINKPGSPLSDIRVREAIAYAIDRPALVKQSSSPIEATQYIAPKTIVGYDATAKFPSLDVAKSKQLQAEAGYPNGVPLVYGYVKGYQLDPPVLIQQLTAAGFKITADPLASTDDYISKLRANKEDLSSLTFDSNYYDATDLFTQILDSRGSTFTFYTDPKFTALIDASEQEFSPAAHIKKAQAITKYVSDNYLWIPVHITQTSIYSVPNYQISQNYQTAPEATNYWQVGQIVTDTKK